MATVVYDNGEENELPELEDQYNEAIALVADGENPYPAMTYVQGIRDALAWVLGESDEPPLEVK